MRLFLMILPLLVAFVILMLLPPHAALADL